MKKLFALLIIFFSANLMAQTIKIDVQGLNCALCDADLVKNFNNYPGVTKAYSNLEKNIILINSNQDISDFAIMKDLTKNGLIVNKISRVDENIEKLIEKYSK